MLAPKDKANFVRRRTLCWATWLDGGDSHRENHPLILTFLLLSLISPGLWLAELSHKPKARKPLGVVYTSASSLQRAEPGWKTLDLRDKRRCPVQMEPQMSWKLITLRLSSWGQTSGWHQIDHPHMPIFLWMRFSTYCSWGNEFELIFCSRHIRRICQPLYLCRW